MYDRATAITPQAENLPRLGAGSDDWEASCPRSATARRERRSAPSKGNGDEKASARGTGQPNAGVRPASRRSWSRPTGLAPSLQHPLARVAAREQRHHEQQSGNHRQQSLLQPADTMGQHDRREQNDSRGRHAPVAARSTWCPDAGADPHRHANIPPACAVCPIGRTRPGAGRPAPSRAERAGHAGNPAAPVDDEAAGVLGVVLDRARQAPPAPGACSRAQAMMFALPLTVSPPGSRRTGSFS